MPLKIKTECPDLQISGEQTNKTSG